MTKQKLENHEFFMCLFIFMFLKNFMNFLVFSNCENSPNKKYDLYASLRCRFVVRVVARSRCVWEVLKNLSFK